MGKAASKSDSPADNVASVQGAARKRVIVVTPAELRGMKAIVANAEPAAPRLVNAWNDARVRQAADTEPEDRAS